MEVEVSQANRNLSRVASQESLNSVSSIRTRKFNAEEDSDASGNEARSIVSTISIRSVAKASKRKRAISNNGNGLEIVTDKGSKTSKGSERVTVVDSNDDQQPKTSRTAIRQSGPLIRCAQGFRRIVADGLYLAE